MKRVTRTRVTRIAAMLIAVAVLAVACGDDSSDVDSSVPTTLVPPTTVAPTTTQPAATTTLAVTTTQPATTTTAAPGTTTTTAAGSCSAASADAGEVGGADVLPEAVFAKAQLIMAAARACDYAALGALAGEPFTFSFGASSDPVAYWQELESSGEPVTAFIVEVLSLSHDLMEIADPDIYVWPAVAGDDATDADWDEVRGLYTEDEIDQMRELGSGYLGWRLGIDTEGDWTFYVAGD